MLLTTSLAKAQKELHKRSAAGKNFRSRVPSSFAFLVTMKIVQLHSDQGRPYKSFVIYFAHAIIHATVTPTHSPHQSLCTVQSCSQTAEVLEVPVPYHFCSCQVRMTNNCPSGSYSSFVLLNGSILVFVFKITFLDRQRSQAETCFL